MSFDPTQPAHGSPLDSAVMRNQLNALNQIIGNVDQAANTNLANAIAGTARNPNSLGPPAFSFSNPPTDTELYALQSWLADFYNALYRTP